MNRYDEMAELQRHWTPPRELAASSPRSVRLTRAGIALIVLAAVMFLGGIALGIVIKTAGNRQKSERDQLSQQGREVQGIITRLWRTTDKESRNMVAYQFDFDGHIYRKSVEASRRVWKTLVLGAPLAIRFVPSNPVLNRPRDWARDPMPDWPPFLIGLLFAGLAALFVFFVRRQMHLLSDGRPAPGVVTHYSDAQHGQKNVHYEFPLMSGSIAKGSSGPSRKPPAIGETLCVIYDRDNPRRNAAYPLELVKLENAGTKPPRRSAKVS